MLRLTLACLAIAAALLAPATARANFEFGARTGFGVPLGGLTEEDGMSEAFVGQVPLWVDLGARVTPRLSLSGFFSLGIGIPGEAFDDVCQEAERRGFECAQTTFDLRFGFQAQYHFSPELAGPDPWIGAGVGYEVAGWGYEVDQDGDEREITFGTGGFEFLNLQGGVDFPVSAKIALGPFGAFTLAQYSDMSIDCSGDCALTEGLEGSRAIDDKALHFWVFVGARVVVLP